MKLIVNAIFLLILIPAVSAAIYEEQIFSNDITSSGTYTGTNKDNFTIALIGDAISIRFPERTLIVKNDSCEESGLYGVCLLITEFSHYNYTGPEKTVNKRNVRISTRVAKLNLTRGIEKTEFWIGEDTEVRMRIQNIGDRPATVSFLDNFSGLFEAAIPLNCDLKSNAVVWKGELSSKEVVTCDYRIKAEKAGTFSSSAAASYNNGISDKTETDGITLTVNDFPLQLESDLSNQSLKLGSNVTAYFKISATENMTVKSLKLRLPDGLRLRSWNGINRLDDGTLEYEGSLDAGSVHEFTLTLAAEKTGTLPIKEATKLALADSKISQSFEREIKANVSVEELYTRIAKPNFSSGANTLNIFVVNPSEQDFYNAELKIETNIPLANKEASFRKVSLLGHEEFSAGFEAATGTYPVTATLTYSSAYGERFSVTKKENVTVAGEAGAAAIPEALNADIPQEAAPQEEPAGETPKAEESQGTGFKIEKSKFSPMAAIVATAIVVIIAGIVVLITARRKKYEDDEF